VQWSICIGHPGEPSATDVDVIPDDAYTPPPSLPKSIKNRGDLVLTDEHVWVLKMAGWRRYTRAEVEEKTTRIRFPFRPYWLLGIISEDGDPRMAYPAWLTAEEWERNPVVRLQAATIAGKNPGTTGID
jgi:hypothetical protein